MFTLSTDKNYKLFSLMGKCILNKKIPKLKIDLTK
jgi:hypothetical protein